MNSFNGNQIDTNYNDIATETIRILIVDDQKMIREGLKALIKTESDLEVIGTCDNGKSSIEQVELLKPDIVLMDMEMPGMDGMEATRIICNKFENVKVLVLSTFDTQEYVARSLSSGAMGYLLKGTPAEELTDAIRSVHRGYAQIGPGVYQNLALNSRANLPQIPDGTRSSRPNNDSALSPRANGQLVPIANKQNNSSALAANRSSGLSSRQFEQTVILRRSPKWSRATVWAVVGVTVFAIAWSAIAKIEQVVPAQGQLKPIGKVKEIQVPTNGVVEAVKVEEGQRVKTGDLLLVLDSTTSQAQLLSLQNIRQSLAQENKFYRALMNGEITAKNIDSKIASLEIPREIASLTRNRASLKAENDLFEAQLGSSATQLDSQQKLRLRTSQAELRSRTEAARLEVEQLEKQLNQNQVQLLDIKAQLATGRQVLAQIKQRNQESMEQAQKSLEIEEKTLSSIAPLVEKGALAKLQVDRQQQEVNDRRATIVQQRSEGRIEYDRQQQQITTLLAEQSRLLEEEKRLSLDIAQAREQLINTTIFSEKDALDRMAENEKRIAEIDSQLNKTIVENQKRTSEIDSQISGAQQTLKYQAISSPVNGTVFDLRAYPGYVPPSGQAAQPVLKIVPEDELIAEVFITPEDIGFVQKGMTTDVRISAFPYSEFGDVKGKVSFISDDSLAPEPPYDFFRYAAKIKLDQPYIEIRGKKTPLQSGMSVQANIKVKENRTVLSLLGEQFFTGLDKFKEVR
jgi:HlyD family secretion protein